MLGILRPDSVYNLFLLLSFHIIMSNARARLTLSPISVSLLGFFPPQEGPPYPLLGTKAWIKCFFHGAIHVSLVSPRVAFTGKGWGELQFPSYLLYLFPVSVHFQCFFWVLFSICPIVIHAGPHLFPFIPPIRYNKQTVPCSRLLLKVWGNGGGSPNSRKHS